MRMGYHVFTHRHYPSRIRGGHTFAETRIASESVIGRDDGYDVLLSLGDSFARNESKNAYYGNEKIKPLTENLDDLNRDGVIMETEEDELHNGKVLTGRFYVDKSDRPSYHEEKVAREAMPEEPITYQNFGSEPEDYTDSSELMDKHK